MQPTQNPDTTTARAVDITPATILRGAARYLELHGWIQGVYFDGAAHLTDGAIAPTDPDHNPFPRCCAAGAIGMAAFGRAVDIFDNSALPGDRDARAVMDAAMDALVDFLDRERPMDPRTDYRLPFDWNDDPDRTAEQVITTLRLAADDYERTHGGAA